MGFRDFRVFFFGYRAQSENPETTEKSLFLSYKAEIHVDLISILTFWVSKMTLAKTNSINLGRSEALKRQIPATWFAMQLNNFEFDVLWTYFKCFETASYITVLWCLCKISMTSEFLFLGLRLKTKTRKSRKIFIY